MAAVEQGSDSDSPSLVFSDAELDRFSFETGASPDFDQRAWEGMDPRLRQIFMGMAVEELDKMELANPAIRLGELDKDTYQEIILTLVARLAALVEAHGESEQLEKMLVLDEMQEPQPRTHNPGWRSDTEVALETGEVGETERQNSHFVQRKLAALHETNPDLASELTKQAALIGATRLRDERRAISNLAGLIEDALWVLIVEHELGSVQSSTPDSDDF